jgi:hypothetical protein
MQQYFLPQKDNIHKAFHRKLPLKTKYLPKLYIFSLIEFLEPYISIFIFNIIININYEYFSNNYWTPKHSFDHIISVF